MSVYDEIREFLNEGYEESFYITSDEVKSVRVVDLSEEDTKELFKCNRETFNLLEPSNDNEKVLFKIKPYHATPLDLVDAIKEFDKRYESSRYDAFLKLWLDFIGSKFKRRQVIFPNLNQKESKLYKYKSDYLFEDDDHLIMYVVSDFHVEIVQNKLPDFKLYISFIESILKERNKPKTERHYSLSALRILVKNAGEVLNYDEFDRYVEIQNFYRKYLVRLADLEDYFALCRIGYDYYEGTNLFEVDPVKAAYYLEKAFKISGDPDLARTLGYIYYYDRTNKGEESKQKAFQYFAIGHIAGHYYEATYKLADCYVNGYGTPVSYQAAFNLVSSIYDETFEHFSKHDDSKFADVALRMGKFFRDGIGVVQDYFAAHVYFLEARCAIKKRLECMEYIGDRSVASSIYESINELVDMTRYNGRSVKDNGYLLEPYVEHLRNAKFSVSQIKNDLFRITLTSKSKKAPQLIFTIPEINFAERAKCAVFEFKLVDMFPEELINATKDRAIDNIRFDMGYLEITFKDNPFKPLGMKIDELIVVPQTLRNIDYQYMIVSVEFSKNSKQYDFLYSKDEPLIGDKLKINIHGQEKTVTVKGVRYCYEDELPLPIEKMETL